MRKNKKIYVYMVLFAVFITQLVFSGQATAGTVSDAVKTDTQDARTLDFENTSALSQDSTAETEVQAVAATAMLNVAEEAHVEPRIVYRSTITSDGEIVDDLTQDTQKNDFENKVISYCEARINIYSYYSN